MFYKIIIFTLLFATKTIAAEPDIVQPDSKSLQDASSLVEEIKINQNTNNDIEDVEEIIKTAEKIKEQNDYEKDVKQITESSNKAAKSKQYQEYESWIKDNKNKLFAKKDRNFIEKEITNKNDKILDKANKDAIGKLLQNYHFKQDDVKKAQIIHFPLMIFVSSSIPQSSLKDLMIQAKKAEAILVLRGFIGSLKNTTEFLARISKENVSAIIDPRLFDIFKIDVVPTFILLKNNAQNCDDDQCAITPLHDRISGNISLNYALETIAAQGDVKEEASKYLKKLEGGAN